MRALALVVALTMAAPTFGLVEDVAFHQSHHDRIGSALGSEMVDATGQPTDPGLGTHIHCGCHVAATADEAMAAPLMAVSRPSYAPVVGALTSLFPDRLPRPPRA